MTRDEKMFLALMGAWGLFCALLLAAEGQDLPAQPCLRLDLIEEKLRVLEPQLERGPLGEAPPPKPSRPRVRTPLEPKLFQSVGPPIVIPPEEPEPEPVAPLPEPEPAPCTTCWTWDKIDDWRAFKQATTGD